MPTLCRAPSPPPSGLGAASLLLGSLQGGSEVPGGLETCSSRDLGPKAGSPSPAGHTGQMQRARGKMHGRFMQHH